jgi:hypothetical protein
MISQLTILAFALSALWGGPHEVQHHHSRIGRWRLEVTTDGFAQRTRCALRSGPIVYHRGALVFQLPHAIDTTAAVYRIDDGPPVDQRRNAMRLAELGFSLHDDQLDNPSGGLVRIPEDEVGAGRKVRIASGAFRAPLSYSIEGFAVAREAARQAGCGPEDFD